MTDRENPKCPMGHEMELLQVASGGWRYGCAKCATSYKVQKKAHYGWLSPIRSTKELAYEAAVKRPMQKPLTLEEVKNIRNVIVWAELVSGELFPARIDGTRLKNLEQWEDVWEVVRSSYKKGWRFWANRPTEEERKAAEWEK